MRRRSLVLAVFLLGACHLAAASDYGGYHDSGYAAAPRGSHTRGHYDEEPPMPRRRSARSSAAGGVASLATRGNRKYGIVFMGGGSVVSALGVALMFEKNLMRLGNFCQVCGLALLFGPARLVKYLMDPKKVRATATFCVGFLLMMRGNPILGLVLEVFGFMNLFGNFFPIVAATLKRMPVVKELFRAPEDARGRGRRRSSYEREYQDDYGDDGYGDSRGYGNDGGRYEDRYDSYSRY